MGGKSGESLLASLPTEPLGTRESRSLPDRMSKREVVKSDTYYHVEKDGRLYNLIYRGEKFPIPFNIPEKASVVAQILEHGMELHRNCKARGEVIRQISGCEISTKQTNLQGLSVEINVGLGVMRSIIDEEKFRDAFKKHIKKRALGNEVHIKEAETISRDDNDTALEKMELSFINFLHGMIYKETGVLPAGAKFNVADNR